MRAALLPVALGLLLMGCAALPPAQPHAPARGRILGDLADIGAHAPVRMGTWPHTAWWTAAHLPALDRLVTTALKNNPGLAAASARLAAAQADIAAAQAGERLHVGAQALMMQAYFSRQGLHTSANGTHVLYTEIDPLMASYHLALWGRTQARIRAAVGATLVERADRAQARLLLSTRIASQYFALAGDIMRMRQVARAERLQTALLRLTEKQRQCGLASAQAVDRVQRARAETAAALDTITADVHIEHHVLAALAGRGSVFGRRIAATLPSRMELVIPRDLPLALITHRPDITAAAAAVTIAAARVGAARAAFYPDINIALLAGWNSIHIADLFSPGNLAHAIGPVITLPIFEGGLLRAHLRAEDALYRAAQAHYRHTLLTAVRQITNRLTRWRATSQRLRHQRRSTEAAEHLAQIAETAYQAGLTGRLAVIRARISLARSRARLAARKTRNAQAWVYFTSALGGGYHEDSP